MSATLATVEAYLTAAQTAFGDGDYTEANKQIILGEIELLKLPTSMADQGSTVQIRSGFQTIRDAIISHEKKTQRGTRRSYLEGV